MSRSVQRVVLPEALALTSGPAWRETDRAVLLVQRYFAEQYSSNEFTGSFFDTWKVGDPNVLTAKDLLSQSSS